MSETYKKVLMDLCVTPWTVLLGATGVSLMLLSFVMGAGWGLFGFICVLGGIGVAASNCLFGFEESTRRVIEQMEQDKKKERDAKLDVLDAKLSSDRDPRDQEALRNLRGLYDSFMDDVKAGKVSVTAGGAMLAQINEIFAQCVSQLEKQHEVWQTSRKVSGDLKNRLLKQKSDILDEVEASVKSLADVMGEVRGLGLKVEHGELTKLQQRLKGQLAAAKATEEIVASAEVGADLTRFAEYEKQ